MSKAKKQSEFTKVLSSKDILVIAFGAMIGWGWVISTGDWIHRGGVLGAAIGFILGGIMIFFVGLTYAELTSAMPQCGGEHVFSYKAMGATGSFICTWGIILGYVGVVCFEACAFPTIVSYIFPSFLKGYLYTVAGFDIYASWLALAVVTAAIMMYINILGAKTAAKLQTVLTAIIFSVGMALILTSTVKGEVDNIFPQMFVGDGSAGSTLKHILHVAVMTPFFFIGFDVIPQAAEEIKGSLKKIGKILIFSIVMAVLFYSFVIIAVGFLLNPAEINQSMSGSGLVTADAMSKAYGMKAVSNVVIIGGLCGIITSWNSFMIGGSRAMYSMADSNMIPKAFAKLHPKYKTPVNALLLIGIISMLSPLAGRQMLVWVCDAGNLGCCLAYCMVSISFLMLRKKAPDMPRPYRVKHYKFVGLTAVIMSGAMIFLYLLPNSGSTLTKEEWMIAGAWSLLGLIFYISNKRKYGEEFGHHIDIEIEFSESDIASLERHAATQ
ncbi:MAG: APC family permease [Eubacteriales bacterium]|nr:APC family permease [Eubacteriales bacterium]MDY3332319.1 APC family permease [Gallibacter sp.]